jgi:hypothetical protein
MLRKFSGNIPGWFFGKSLGVLHYTKLGYAL